MADSLAGSSDCCGWLRDNPESVAAIDRALHRVLGRPGLTAPDIDDLVQDAWLRILSTDAVPESEAKLVPWAVALGRNLLYDSFKKRARSRTVHLKDVTAVRAAETESDERLLYNLARTVLRFLRGCPQVQEDVVLLHYYGGLDLADIILLTEESAQTVYQAHCRAKKKLKNLAVTIPDEVHFQGMQQASPESSEGLPIGDWCTILDRLEERIRGFAELSCDTHLLLRLFRLLARCRLLAAVPPPGQF